MITPYYNSVYRWVGL